MPSLSSKVPRSPPRPRPKGTAGRCFPWWFRVTERTGRWPRSKPRSPANRKASAHWSNTAPSRRAAGYRRYSAPYIQPQLPIQNAYFAPSPEVPEPGCLPATAPLCIRAFWPACFRFCVRVTLLNLSGNAPVVMGRLVMKFGGTSVANIDRIRNVARHVKREVDAGHDVAVVVSAMAGKTNELVEWCGEASPMHDAREYDAVVASGEQVTAGLLAIVLQAIGIQARSWQGWQIPIRTSDAHASARILEIDGSELISRFKDRKEVAVIAGFQGINPQTGRITTLGRGGSDTSAVAIAAAIHADRCDIYTDVDGVYTTDPRVVPKARRLDKIAFEDMLELASQGAKELQVRSDELGKVHNMPVFVRSSFDKPEDIDPHANQPPGTLICSEEEIMENHVVTGIAFSKDEAQISVRQIQDKPGVAAAIFGPLADANINVDMIVQNVSEDGAATDLTFTVPASDYARARETITSAKGKIGYERLDSAPHGAKVSVLRRA